MVDVISHFKRSWAVGAFASLRLVNSLNVKFRKEAGGIEQSGAPRRCINSPLPSVGVLVISPLEFVPWPCISDTSSSQPSFPVAEMPVSEAFAVGLKVSEPSSPSFLDQSFSVLVIIGFGCGVVLFRVGGMFGCGLGCDLLFVFLSISLLVFSLTARIGRSFARHTFPTLLSLFSELCCLNFWVYDFFSHVGCSTVRLVRGAVSPARGGGVSHFAMRAVAWQ